MSDPREESMERLLSSATRPAADPAFRARLRERFLDLSAATAPDARTGIERETPVTAPIRRVPVRNNIFPLIWPLVLAASVAGILFFVLSRDAVVRWRVLDLPDGAQYVVDGYVVDTHDTARMADLLQTAHEIDTQDQALRLQLLDQLVLEVAPHSKVSQLSFPTAGAHTIRADSGSLRVVTGPGFSALRVLTDDMQTDITGTAFAIDVVATGTCLCCLHGSVRCDTRDGTGAHAVGGGRRGFGRRDGKPGDWSAAEEAHVAPLRELEALIERTGWKK